MSMRDTDVPPDVASLPVVASSPIAAAAAAPALEAASSEPQGGTEPVTDKPAADAIEARAPDPTGSKAAASDDAAELIDRPKMIEMPKVIVLPRAVEAAMKAAQATKAASPATETVADAVLKADRGPHTTLDEPVAPAPAEEQAEGARTSRFAMLAASVALAGALGAMLGAIGAGAIGTGVVARPVAAAQTPVAAVDLSPLQVSIASLRAEVAAIKSTVETSNRTASAQLAKVNERLDRVAQAVPAAQLKQALDAIDRLEKRAQAQSGDVTGSVRPQQVASAAEPTRSRIIDGWTLRSVSHGVAVIEGRRIGAIEIETGDIVPGVGRIEAIRRQDGRWVVLTSNGMITSPTQR